MLSIVQILRAFCDGSSFGYANNTTCFYGFSSFWLQPVSCSLTPNVTIENYSPTRPRVAMNLGMLSKTETTFLAVVNYPG